MPHTDAEFAMPHMGERRRWLAALIRAVSMKQRVTLRLDAEMLDWFRRQGRGYGARINAILRRHDEHARRRLRP